MRCGVAGYLARSAWKLLSCFPLKVTFCCWQAKPWKQLPIHTLSRFLSLPPLVMNSYYFGKQHEMWKHVSVFPRFSLPPPHFISATAGRKNANKTQKTPIMGVFVKNVLNAIWPCLQSDLGFGSIPAHEHLTFFLFWFSQRRSFTYAAAHTPPTQSLSLQEKKVCFESNCLWICAVLCLRLQAGNTNYAILC